MVIELRGVEFHNKGAELMLLAILQKVREQYPTATFAMETRVNVSLKDKKKQGIKTKYVYKMRGLDLSFLGFFLPKSYRNRKNLILESEIDVVLDGSGFAYGDFWGAKKCYDRLSKHLSRWKSNGKKVILLSQAFGPFENQELKKEMIKVVKLTDLVFTRDKYSNSHVCNLLPNAKNVFLKPDFTNLIKGYVPERIILPKDYMVIVPNHKLIESKVFKNREEYIAFLKSAIIYLQEQGQLPVFLNHEGKKDYQLMEDVNQQLTEKIPLINEKDPLIIKGVIGGARSILTSRFHGLVSGLSQNVPSLCLGWSHKYLALLEDYGVENLLFEETDMNKERLEAKLDQVINEESRLSIVKVLQSSSVAQKKLSTEMWRQVFSTIGQV